MRSPARTEETFVGRWSRLKREGGPAVPVAQPQPEAPPPAAPAADVPPPLTDADMPALETLDEGSDFSGFLSPGVSDELRSLALKKLFGLPQFNQLDGLNDYDEDFTKLEPLGNAVTYQMRQWAERKARDALAGGEETAQMAGDELAELPDDAAGAADPGPQAGAPTA